MTRLTIDEVCMATAKIWSQRATCSKKAVGCCITTQDGRVIACGYNGAARGMDHCLDIGCLLDDVGDCVRSLHAEQNAIATSAHSGIGLQGSIMYITDFPCHRCAQLIITAGIKRVVYANEPTKSSELVQFTLAIFQSANVSVRKI